ncbi:hypothetical protein HDV04_001976 [Boothiomyces sp. JEL0838]|nr:hypothetical protein HDV04_001976 [Boothiomyces sp. JEL0838]
MYDNPLPLCGAAHVDIERGCCISSVDLEFTYNYQSLTRNYISINDSLTFPTSSNGHGYCTLTAADQNSLLGYSQVFYLANGQCIEDTVVCNLQDGTISIHNNTNCSGYKETFDIHSNSIFNSLIFGNITASSQEISNAKLDFIWTGYTPQAELVPKYKAGVEVFAAVCYSIAILIGTVISVYYGRMYFKFKKLRDILFMISEIFITTNVIIQVVYYNTVFVDNLALAKYDSVMQIFHIYSLFSVYISLFILFTIFVEFQNTIWEKLVYGLFTAIHFSCLYYNFIDDILMFANIESNSLDLTLTNAQAKGNSIWYPIYLVMEVAPSFVILYKMIIASKSKKIKEKLRKQMGFIMPISVIQICNIIVYEVFGILCNQTLVLKDDRTLLSMDAVLFLLQMNNSFLTLVIYEKLRLVMKLITKNTYHNPT